MLFAIIALNLSLNGEHASVSVGLKSLAPMVRHAWGDVMRCSWSVLGILASFFSGVALGTAIYRWVKGGEDPNFLLAMIVFALLLGVISVLTGYLEHRST